MPDENPLLPLIRAALHGVNDPEIHRPITELGMVDDVHAADDGEVVVRILLTTGGCPLKDRDGDGVEDTADNCPDEKGPVENQGCPA